MEAYLNSINNVKSSFNETRKLTQLRFDHRYPVQEFKMVKTKFGTSKIATLMDENNKIIDVFLPNRFTDVVFNNNYKHYLIYHGKKSMKDGRQFHDVEFKLESILNHISYKGVNYDN